MSRYQPIRDDYEGSSHWPGMIGLGFITLATVTNFALAGMTQKEIDSLPPVVGVPYEIGGRLGITMLLIAVGILVIATGQVVQAIRRRRHQPDPWDEQVRKYSSLMNMPSRGGVRLETAKYLTPPEPMVFAERRQEQEAKGEVTAA